MARLTLQDITLAEYRLDRLPRLDRLRSELSNARPEVCIERARFVTRYLKELSTEDEPMETRCARAVAYFLSRKAPLFFDDNLLAGTTASKPFAAPVYPELTGLTIWPELDTISTRPANPLKLSKAEAEELNFTIYPYWMERTVLEATRKRARYPESMKLFERIVFFIASKAGTISHTIPDYSVALEKGLEHLIAEAALREATLRAKRSLTLEETRSLHFFEAVQVALGGILAYAGNLADEADRRARFETDPWRRDNFLKMAEVCRRVPAKGARTFREAVNALWIIQVGIHAENINMAMSPGRLDQVLYPYFERDRARGTLSIDDALELIGCLWLKLNDNTNLVPETAEELFGGAGTVPAVTVGGVDAAGEDAVNDLTYLMLRVTELLQTRDPSLNARYHYEKNTRDYRDRVARVIAHTRAVPAVYNDAAAVKTLVNQGTRLEHARDYATIGCVELGIPGKSYDASSSIMLNLVSALELALYDGTRPATGTEPIGPQTGDPADFRSFGEFWEAFKTQLRFLIGQAVKLNEHFGRTCQDIMPTPLLSAFFSGPMKDGRDLIFGGALYNASGATHIGFADTVDSLNAIERAVFSADRRCDFATLITALKSDFEGHDALHAYLVHRTPKYGTEDPIALKNSQNLVRFLYETYQGYENYRGGKYRPAYWTMTNHAGQGKLCGALPSGRRSGRVLASGITPVSQAAGSLAACFQAVGSLDPLCIPGGEALNLKYPMIESEEDLTRFSQAIEAYFRTGGLHVQFNILSYETLLDAREHPERHPELLVRVSGYSAYFKDLNDAMKEEIITRTAYDLRTGEAIAFPQTHRRMLPTEKAMEKPRRSVPTPDTLIGMLPDRLGLRLITRRFAACLQSELAEGFLVTLLQLMRLVFILSPSFRANLEGFRGRYAFRSREDGIATGVVFEAGTMRVASGPVDHADVSIVFRNSKALMDYLLSPKPDILGSLLRQDVVVEGNFNYLYKFAFMANRLRLTVMPAS